MPMRYMGASFNDNYYLQSFYSDKIWPRGEQCNSTLIPFMYFGTSSDGIHSFKEMNDTINYMIDYMVYYENNTRDFPDNVCVGQIYNWGKIVEHKKGYRAEFAYPKKLYVFNNLENSQQLRRNYGCDVTNIEMSEIKKDIDMINIKYGKKKQLFQQDDALSMQFICAKQKVKIKILRAILKSKGTLK